MLKSTMSVTTTPAALTEETTNAKTESSQLLIHINPIATQEARIMEVTMAKAAQAAMVAAVAAADTAEVLDAADAVEATDMETMVATTAAIHAEAGAVENAAEAMVAADTAEVPDAAYAVVAILATIQDMVKTVTHTIKIVVPTEHNKIDLSLLLTFKLSL